MEEKRRRFQASVDLTATPTHGKNHRSSLKCVKMNVWFREDACGRIARLEQLRRSRTKFHQHMKIHLSRSRHSTGRPLLACTWFRECSRQVEAEVVSNSRKQLHQTTYRVRQRNGSQVARILFLLMLTTSAWPCLKNSRNLGTILLPALYKP